MILERLTLRNFCLYRGEQSFDLTPSRRRGRAAPVVLVGGINGGGKTTILDAVQLALYGNRARPSKRADNPYDLYLQESIHHGVEPSEGAGIRLSFRYAAEGDEHLYEVSRAWGVNEKGRIRERVQISRDGELDGWLSDNWNQLVEDLLPIGIAQLCFFDGEKIRFLAEDETSARALGEAIRSLLGLDLAERLVADASVLEARIANRVGKSPERQEVEQLENQLSATQSEIDRLVQELGALENSRQAAIRRLKQAEDIFAKVGGRHWEQRQDQQRQLAELGHALQDSDERLADLAATELPLALVPELLHRVAAQDRLERQAEKSITVASFLTERDDQLLTQLRDHGASPGAIQLVKKLLDADRTSRCATLSVELRLTLGEVSRRLLERLLDGGLSERRDLAVKLLESRDRFQRAVEQLQRTLAVVPDEAIIRDVAQELKEASTASGTLNQELKRLDKELASLRRQRDDLRCQLSKLHRKVIDEQLQAEEDSRIARLLVRTQETMKAFVQKATCRKIDRLSEFITESFRYLLRKETLIERVLVDPRDLTVTLFDRTGRSIPKQRLSEGEKQILAISVLWGLSRASARPLPAIIDTPMARLDANHRDQLVQRYFPHASHQVIVLSTDTEVDRRYFHHLQPHIARAYHLNYDEERKATVAEEGYFWDAMPMAEHTRATV